MSNLDKDAYVPTIDAILGVSDLEKVSVKRIRGALQELFAVQFVDDKKDINDLILERYHNLMEERDQEKERLKQIETSDAILSAKLQEEERGLPRRKPTAHKVTKRAKRKANTTPSGNSLSGMELNLSPKLAELLNTTRLPRTQVVKQVWDYIKQHNLQNPNDKREILCDDKMAEIFGKKVTMFSMNKVLSQHLYKDDEVS